MTIDDSVSTDSQANWTELGSIDDRLQHRSLHNSEGKSSYYSKILEVCLARIAGRTKLQESFSLAIVAVAFDSPIHLFLTPLRVVFGERRSSVAPRIVKAAIERE